MWRAYAQGDEARQQSFNVRGECRLTSTARIRTFCYVASTRKLAARAGIVVAASHTSGRCLSNLSYLTALRVPPGGFLC